MEQRFGGVTAEEIAPCGAEGEEWQACGVELRPPRIVHHLRAGHKF